MDYNTKNQCLITQTQIISMQIEFANTTKLNYYLQDTQKGFSIIGEKFSCKTSYKISTHFVVVKINNK